MKTLVFVALSFLLGMKPGLAQSQLQSVGFQSSFPSLSPQGTTTDPGVRRFAGSWKEVIPKPFQGLNFLGGMEAMSGQVSAITVDLVHDPTGNLVYVGSSSGGVWKSTNGLSASPHFVALSDQSQSLSVGAIALDTRTNPPTIYVGTGAPDNSSNISSYTGVGILSTKNNGASWTKVDSADGGAHSFVGLGFSSILVDPVDPDILLAATGMATDPNHPPASVPQGDPGFNNLGIYRSADAGKTWTQVMGPEDYKHQGSALTCGQPPTSLNPSGYFHIDLLYEPTQAIYYAGVTGVGLFASSDQGSTWKSLSTGVGTGLPAGDQMAKVSLASRDGQLWALVLIDRCSSPPFSLHTSTDNGKSWISQALPPDMPPDAGLFKGSLMYVAAPPGSSALLFATQFLFMTDTLASPPSWQNIEHNIHDDQHAIAFAGSKSWYVGDDGGAWATTDGGQTWTSLNSGLRTLEFLSADQDSDGTYAGGLQDNGAIIGSLPSGWQQITGNDGTYVSADPQDPNAFFMSNQGGQIFYVKTTDVAKQLPVVNFNDGSIFMAPFEILKANPTVRSGVTGSGASIVNNGRILLAGDTNPWLVAFDPSATSNPCVLQPPKVTCDHSLPSNPQAVQLTGKINQVIDYIAPVPGDPTTAFVVAGASLFKISNISFAGLANATPITTGPVNGEILGHLAVDRSGTLYLIVVGFLDGNKIFKTTDLVHWTNISGNLPNVPFNWITLDPVNGSIYLATNVGVYVATDGEVVQWKKLGTGLPNVPVTQLKITPAGTLLAATFGRNAWILSDPCDTVRELLANVDCTTPKGTFCRSRTKALTAALNACEVKYGELPEHCGFVGQPCCGPNASCQAGLACDGSNTCACGGVDEPCCGNQTTGFSCNSQGLACDQRNFTCRTTCGNEGQSCCANLQCNSGMTCSGGICECGGQNEACCLQGQACKQGQVCANGRCVNSSSSCAQCTTDKQQCIVRCGNDTRCQCLCGNSYCGCVQQNSCGLCSYQSCP